MEKFNLEFSIDSNGIPRAKSIKHPGLDSVLEDFKYHTAEILDNTQKYIELITENPIENMVRGIVSDEQHFEYWNKLEKLNYFGSDASAMDINGKKVTLSLSGEDFMEITLSDFLNLLKQWHEFLVEKRFKSN
ncbi:MAG: hypothetical protein KDD31_09875 [Muricauda sp.]|nr:hypothetical protein [Allomuricauda sp.]